MGLVVCMQSCRDVISSPSPIASSILCSIKCCMLVYEVQKLNLTKVEFVRQSFDVLCCVFTYSTTRKRQKQYVFTYSKVGTARIVMYFF